MKTKDRFISNKSLININDRLDLLPHPLRFAAFGGTHLSDLDVSDGHGDDGDGDEGHGARVRDRTQLHLDPTGLTLEVQVYTRG